MITVSFKTTSMYRVVPDNESPWGCREIVEPTAVEWLEERLADELWDYEFQVNQISFFIDESARDVALLFKLTFGGL